MNYPHISVIIVTFNAANTIKQALHSVLQQSIKVELIVIDGGSTDGTKDIVLGFGDKINFFISEPDAGIYDAMNKAIDRAHGQWMYFLGADDALQPDVLATIVEYLDDKFSIVFGNVLFDNGLRMKSYLGRMTLFKNTIHHQSAFYHKSLFESFRYDKQLRTLADYELNLLVYMRKLPTMYIPVIIAFCQTGGASSDWTITVEETNQIRERYLSSTFLRKGLSLMLRLYYTQKIIRNRFLPDNSRS